MVPVYVAGALVFGFVFLQIIQNSEFKPDASQTASYFVKQNACTGENGGSCQMFTFGEGDQAFVLEARGEPFTMQNGCADGSGDTPGPAASVVNLASGAIGKIIINVLGLIVMWAAVFAALNTSKITQKAVEPIGEFGNSIANAAKTLPKNMPITVPGTDKQISMTGLQQAGRNLESAVNSGSNYTGGMEADVFKKILDTGAVGNILSELQEMNRKNPVNMNIPEQVGKRVKDMLDLAAQNGYGSDKIAANTNNIRTDLVKAMVEMGMKKEVAEAMLAGNTGIQVAGNIADYSRKNSNNVFGKAVTNEEAQEILDKNVKMPTTTTLKTDKKDEGSTDNQNSNNPSSSGVN